MRRAVLVALAVAVLAPTPALAGSGDVSVPDRVPGSPAARPLAGDRVAGGPLDPVKELLDGLCQVDLCVPPPFYDRLICSISAVVLYPGVPGVVDVSPEGDIRVLGRLVHDCPPTGSRGGAA